ncbi:hypothetical protein AVDCRST_MAG94-3820 [uncultured Leptolyngbya sp.]|uniref:Uncharacterized protein n=1 Tax=uncultured Leptolyngbya sp. TaxID=332963 RepID=A0A6J4MRU8_9CYAN|nr:hypothetical protein AVDCRST_MAG94-3820 [uncultured Leptolyngbya sp.]
MLRVGDRNEQHLTIHASRNNFTARLHQTLTLLTLPTASLFGKVRVNLAVQQLPITAVATPTDRTSLLP